MGSEFTCGGLSLGRSTIEGDGTSIESNSEPDVFIGVTSIVDEHKSLSIAAVTITSPS